MTMKNNVIKLGMLAFLSVLIIGVLLAGCGGSGEQGASSATKHYAENGISFDYPNTWGAGNSSDPNAIAALVSPSTGVFVVVLKETMPSGYTLKIFNDETVMSMNPTQMIAGTFPTVAEVPACESVFKTNDSQMRTVILEKNDNIYVIICSAPVAEFDNAQTSFNMVINSFEVQA
jgi:hypothetical protein